jgi:hypothetical protein
MKMKIVMVLCVAVLGLGSATPAVARTDPDEAFFDAILGRPVGFAATLVGGAAFVVSLPFTAASGSIKSSADSLVGKPARFTFTRPLGDFRYPRYRHAEHNAAQKNSKPVPAKQNQVIAQSGSL